MTFHSHLFKPMLYQHSQPKSYTIHRIYSLDAHMIKNKTKNCRYTLYTFLIRKRVSISYTHLTLTQRDVY